MLADRAILVRARLPPTVMDTLVASILLGIIGSGYFMYGRKAHNYVALLSGLLLCVFPYFIDSLLWTLVVGAVLMAAPFAITL